MKKSEDSFRKSKSSNKSNANESFRSKKKKRYFRQRGGGGGDDDDDDDETLIGCKKKNRKNFWIRLYTSKSDNLRCPTSSAMPMSGGTTRMLRARRKDCNVKPNRRLDKKSSRGMLYENEELRMRTITINAEVEQGGNTHTYPDDVTNILMTFC